MILQGIEYCVVLFIMDENDMPDYEAHFNDFQEFNAFVRENINNEKYVNSKLSYSIVELIDNEPYAFGWTCYIQWKEFSDKEIKNEIEEFLRAEKESKEHSKKIDEFSREIHFCEEDVNYLEKKEHFKEYEYVCPRCIRKVEDCRCAVYPTYLVQIDKLMVPIIRELNSKGYRTIGCCAGHPKDEKITCMDIYIKFAEDYDFDEPFPKGGKYSKSAYALHYTVLSEEVDDLLEYQSNILCQLQDWAEMLFDVDFFDDEE